MFSSRNINKLVPINNRLAQNAKCSQVATMFKRWSTTGKTSILYIFVTSKDLNCCFKWQLRSVHFYILGINIKTQAVDNNLILLTVSQTNSESVAQTSCSLAFRCHCCLFTHKKTHVHPQAIVMTQLNMFC